jgi:two-component system, sensor histidine kinase and response regulator
MFDIRESTVLIVDDNAHNLQVLGGLLQAAEYKPILAQSGKEAVGFLKETREDPPDIILLDVMMPEMDGFETCRRIKEMDHARDIPILFITALSETQDKLKAFSVGGLDYITKPFAHEEVLARVKTHLQNRRLTMRLLQANEELRELNKLKNKFLGMAAHDLRNPLAGIQGFSEILASGDAGEVNDEQKEYLDIIQECAVFMFSLVDDLLDVAVIESGKFELDLKPGSINDLVQRRVRLVSPMAIKKHLTIRTSLEDARQVPFDSNRLSQVVDNLLTNAIKFSPPGKTITVSVKEGEAMIEINIRDEGPGISEEEQSRLFGDFQRLSSRPTAGEESTGLGLFISKKIAKAHGGIIRVDSRLGEGSTFTLVLPMDQEAAPESP